MFFNENSFVKNFIILNIVEKLFLKHNQIHQILEKYFFKPLRKKQS